MLIELTAHAFGAKTGPIKETTADRTARLDREGQTALDSRALKMRRRMRASAAQAGTLFGGGEAQSLLGAGL